MTAKFLGVELEDNIDAHQVVMEEPDHDFVLLAAAALENAGIDPQD